MKKFARVGALFALLVGMGIAVIGCSGGDGGMGKKVDNTESELAR